MQLFHNLHDVLDQLFVHILDQFAAHLLKYLVWIRLLDISVVLCDGFKRIPSYLRI